MKKLALTILIALSTTLSSWASPQVGAYRGYDAISFDLQARMFDITSEFAFIEYILGDPDLALLLGGYVLDRETHVFKNGTPNAVNVTLYGAAFRMLAEGLSQACERGATTLETPKGKSVPFATHFRSIFAPACSALSTSTPAPEPLLRTLWESWIGYGMDTEADAWIAFVRELESSSTPVELKRTQAFLGVFLHPYFLLER